MKILLILLFFLGHFGQNFCQENERNRTYFELIQSNGNINGSIQNEIYNETTTAPTTEMTRRNDTSNAKEKSQHKNSTGKIDSQ